MIRIIDGRERHKYARNVDEMHRLRKKTFYDRRKWDVPIVNNWEIDGYDALCPLYLVCLNQNGTVVGGLRLLPTTGFTMINDTFSLLLPDKQRIESPLIWESSRFVVDHEADIPIGKKGISRATAELGLAVNEIGMRTGLTHIVTVYDAFLHRVLTRAGCAGKPLSTPRRIGAVMAYAVLFDVNMETDTALRDASDIEGSVLERTSSAPVLHRAAA